MLLFLEKGEKNCDAKKTHIFSENVLGIFLLA
jgi:hypothetical protein